MRAWPLECSPCTPHIPPLTPFALILTPFALTLPQGATWRVRPSGDAGRRARQGSGYQGGAGGVGRDRPRSTEIDRDRPRSAECIVRRALTLALLTLTLTLTLTQVASAEIASVRVEAMRVEAEAAKEAAAKKGADLELARGAAAEMGLQSKELKKVPPGLDGTHQPWALCVRASCSPALGPM